ncbi:MAG: HTH domain-containing protein [Planctomycetota bacterium]
MSYQRELTWREAVEKVLREAGEPMHYTDVADEIAKQELRINLGATPSTTVSATVGWDIRNHGDQSTFRRFGPGMIGLREAIEPPEPETPADSTPDGSVSGEVHGIVQALGMFWRRDRVEWKASPVLMGQQQPGSTPVDFSAQRGVYLLHDGRETVYVGRSVDRPLGRRLFEHTIDRLNGRWDRFSWFGLLGVDEGGHLHEVPNDGFGDAVIIEALEAVLIESLEPPLNRRRGDHLQEVEYLQAADPGYEQRQREQMVMSLLRR